jgi:hypothetical protein
VTSPQMIRVTALSEHPRSFPLPSCRVFSHGAAHPSGTPSFVHNNIGAHRRPSELKRQVQGAPVGRGKLSRPKSIDLGVLVADKAAPVRDQHRHAAMPLRICIPPVRGVGQGPLKLGLDSAPLNHRLHNVVVTCAAG